MSASALRLRPAAAGRAGRPAAAAAWRARGGPRPELAVGPGVPCSYSKCELSSLSSFIVTGSTELSTPDRPGTFHGCHSAPRSVRVASAIVPGGCASPAPGRFAPHLFGVFGCPDDRAPVCGDPARRDRVEPDRPPHRPHRPGPPPRGGGAGRALTARASAGYRFAPVLTSPLDPGPARRAELAGLGEGAVVDPDLAEWDYGDYEGLTTAEIRRERPGWDLFDDGCPGWGGCRRRGRPGRPGDRPGAGRVRRRGLRGPRPRAPGPGRPVGGARPPRPPGPSSLGPGRPQRARAGSASSRSSRCGTPADRRPTRTGPHPRGRPPDGWVGGRPGGWVRGTPPGTGGGARTTGRAGR